MRPRSLLQIIVWSSLVLLQASCDPFSKPKSSSLKSKTKTSSPVTAVGRVDGTFSVSPNGSATYIVPLTVPPGTHDVDPDLSLSYDSSRGNGYLGMGWALNGISSITRCGRKAYLDGMKGGVGLDANDRFCLDGIRLVLVSGREGADGAVYHTERETWTQVTAVGSCPGGPCSFTAVNKDGATLTFGIGDSQILASNNPAVLVWSAKRFTDLNGNFTEVNYAVNRTTGEYYPAEINYTGNDSQNFAPSRKVKFFYEPRPDHVTGFVAGAQTLMSMRLTNVQTFVQGNLVLDYQLGYGSNPILGTSRLQSLTLCGNDGVCLPQTSFSWQDAPYRMSPPQTAGSDGLLLSSKCWDGGMTRWGDVNGDGLADFLCDNNATSSFAGTHWAELSTKQGLRPASSEENGRLESGWCKDKTQISWWADVDGNGLPDLNCHDVGASKHYVLFTTLAAKKIALVSRTPNDPNGLVLSHWCKEIVSSMDFNGDGRADLGCYDQGHGRHYVMLSNGNGYVSPNDNPYGMLSIDNWCTGGNGVVTWSDFDGDGKADLHCFDVSQKNHYVMLSTGTDIVPANTNNGGTNGYVGQTSQNSIGSWGDLNGDGKVDFLTSAVDDSGNIVGTHSVFYSNGKNLMGSQPIATNWCQGQKNIVWADVNGDGRVDMDCYDRTGLNVGADHDITLSNGWWQVAVNNNSGNLLSNWCDGASQISWGDFNGDGLGDIFCDNLASRGSGGQGKHYVMMQVGPKADLIGSIFDGLGGSVGVIYSTLTDKSIYTTSHRSVYPVQDVQNGHTVVQSVARSDGRGNTYTSDYRYSGAKSDLSGYGWLGFKTVTEIQEASGLTTVMTFNQDPGQHGTVTSTKISNSANQILRTTATEYVVTKTVPGNDFILQILPQSEITGIYEGGTLGYTLKKQFEYDAFGNMTVLSDLGDPNLQDQLYTCMTYLNDTTAWRLGYLQSEQSSSDAATCRSYLTAPKTAWYPNTLERKWYEYDDRRNVQTESKYDDANSVWLTMTYGYDSFGNKQTLTDAAGHTTTHVFDEDYKTFLVQSITPQNQQGVALNTGAGFDANFGGLTSITDPNGNTIRRTYDSLGRLDEIIVPDPSGNPSIVSKTVWGSDGTGYFQKEMKKTQWSDTDNFDSWYAEIDYIDGLGRTYRSRTVGARASAAPSVSNLQSPTETLSSGPETQTLGQDPNSPWVVNEDIVFDTSGRTWKESFPYFDGDTPDYIVTTYDNYNRPSLVTLPDGMAKQLVYDLTRKKITTTEAYGQPDAQTTVRILNSRGHTVTKTLPNGAVANFQYDALQRLKQSTDPLNISSVFVYDSIGRIGSSTDPDRGATTYQYDTAGHFQSKTDAEGQVVSFTYDDLGRMLTKTLQNKDGSSQNFSYTYDDPSVANGKGNLTQYSDTSGASGPATTYAYDQLGQIASVQKTIANRNYVFQQSYDAQGREDSLTFPDGFVQQQTYGTSGLPSGVDLYAAGSQTPVNYATYNDYDARENLLNATHGLGAGQVTYQYAYYPLSQQTGTLQTLSISTPTQTLFNNGYQWDDLRNLKTLASGVPQPTVNESFTYDPTNMGFLKTANGRYGTQNYDYDTIGGLKTRNGVNYTYFSGTHRIQSGTDGSSYTYFKHGGLATKTANAQSWSYAYNAEKRLTAATLNDATINQYLYDDDGTRVQKTDANGAVTTYLSDAYEVTVLANQTAQYTKYVFGPDGLIATLTAAGYGDTQSGSRISSLYDGTHFTGFLKSASARFNDPKNGFLFLRAVQILCCLALAVICILVWMRKWKTDLTQSRPLLARLAPLLLFFFLAHPSLAHADLSPGGNGSGVPVLDPSIVFFHADDLGSTIALTNESGGLITGAAYLPYGLVDQGRSTGPDIFRPKFSGKEYDADTGNYDFTERYYDPTLGSFTTPDPARQTFNPYTYAGDSPLSAVDPDGEFFFIVAAVVIVAAGVLIGAYAGGSIVNHDFNPLHWDWKSGKTYLGILGGAAIGGIASAAGLAVAAVGGAVGGTAGLAIGIAGEMVIGAGENAAFAAMGGGSAKEILIAAGEGALFGGVLGGAGAAAGALGRRIGSQLIGEGAEIVEEGFGEARAVRREAAGLCSSFAGDTEVLTGDGWKPIEDVATGDRVLSWNEYRSTPEWKDVTELHRRMAGDVVTLVVSDVALTTTAHHKFLTHDRAWVTSQNLKEGESIATLDSDQKISWSSASVDDEKNSNDPILVHNMEVRDNHNYFVSNKDHATAVLAHNGKCQLNKNNATNIHLDANRRKRVSWIGGTNGTRATLLRRQAARGDRIRSAVKSLAGGRRAIELPRNAKTSWGATVWQIDHVISYKYLWKAARYAKTYISAQTFRQISNDLRNLRLLYYEENISHRFEILDKIVGLKSAMSFLRRHYGIRF